MENAPINAVWFVTEVIFGAFSGACGTETHSLYIQQCNKQLAGNKSTGLSIINHKM